MKTVNCLVSQESLFETRVLKRMAHPVFINHETISIEQKHPLILFGDWFKAGFEEGLKWLAKGVFNFSQPCILCAPFNRNSLSDVLGLKVSLEVNPLSVNKLKTDDEALIFFCEKSEFHVQADFAFSGSGGKSLLYETLSGSPVVVIVQPTNTATPLLICGIRLFSASGLSDDYDREMIFNGLMDWAEKRPKEKNLASANQAAAPDEKAMIAREKLNLLAVMVAATGKSDRQTLMAYASAIFGIDLNADEIKEGFRILTQKRVITIQNEEITILLNPLEEYVQELGLWPYVRMLKEEIKDQR